MSAEAPLRPSSASLYRRQLLLSAATLAVMAMSVVLVIIASRFDSVLVHLGVGGAALIAVATLLVACIRHAMGVAVHVFGPNTRGSAD